MNYQALGRLNFQHLRYFWVVAREGGLVPAARALRLSHPTLSAQVHALEEQLGEKLFAKQGRRLALTEAGADALRFADEIFSLGLELVESMSGRAPGTRPLDVGVADVVPKYVVRKLLEPALRSASPARLRCYEDSFDRLLSRLALHELDLVIADSPLPPGHAARAFNHPIGETSVSFFATAALAKKLRRGFPRALDGAPMLLPLEGAPVRRALDQWFAELELRPTIVAELEDSALLKVFGGDGLGVFPAPTAVEAEVVAQYGVELVGRAPEVIERFYVISPERRLKNPAVVAICAEARRALRA